MDSFENIRRHALPLLVYSDDLVLASGTACMIGPHLALTAKHVIEDYVDRFGLDRSASGGFDARFTVVLHQQVGSEEFLWAVDRIWFCALTDAAVMRVSPYPKSDTRPRPQWWRWSLSLFPPSPDVEVVGFGYHDTTAIITKDGPVEWRVNAGLLPPTGRRELASQDGAGLPAVPMPEQGKGPT
jgi:hypothetical protein